MTRRNQVSARGFTLVEMMIIVIIVGVLATLATFGVLKYVRTSRTSEALALVNDIKVAEEIYKDETLSYLNVQDAPYHSWHPSTPPGNYKGGWLGNSNPAGDAFRTLAVVPSGPVYFRYTVVAGPPGNVLVPTFIEQLPSDFRSTSPNEPYYVVIARGDLNGDGTFSHVMGHSFGASVIVDHEGE